MSARQLRIDFPVIQEPVPAKAGNGNGGYTGINRKYAEVLGVGAYWMPKMGEIIRFYPDGGLVEIDGVAKFVGWSGVGVVLDVASQNILVYYPSHSEYKDKEWIGTVSASICYPICPADTIEFEKRKINEDVSAVFGFVTRPPATK